MAKSKNISDAMGDLLGLEKKHTSKPAGKGSSEAAAGRRNIYIEDDLFKRLKIYAAKNDTSASAIISDLVRAFLRDNE